MRNRTSVREPCWGSSRLGDLDPGNVHVSLGCTRLANLPTPGFNELERRTPTPIWHESLFDTFLSRYGATLTCLS
jgi:hypothetical protein